MKKTGAPMLTFVSGARLVNLAPDQSSADRLETSVGISGSRTSFGSGVPVPGANPLSPGQVHPGKSFYLGMRNPPEKDLRILWKSHGLYFA
jgi:hypothetical protein